MEYVNQSKHIKNKIKNITSYVLSSKILLCDYCLMFFVTLLFVKELEMARGILDNY